MPALLRMSTTLAGSHKIRDMSTAMHSSAELENRRSWLNGIIQLWRKGRRTEAHEEMERIIDGSSHPVSRYTESRLPLPKLSEYAFPPPLVIL